jgi:hypothetical protein
MVVDNHEYYQTNRLGPEAASGPQRAGRDWESRSRTTCRLGRDPSTFLKKIFSNFLKWLLSQYAVLAATTNGAQTQYLPRRREKLQHYGGRQPKSLELQLLWLSTTTSTIKVRERSDPGGNRLGPGAASGPPGSRTRLGEPVSDDMSSRTGYVNFFDLFSDF